MKCLSNGCKDHSLLMTVELCHPCMQKIEKGSDNDFEPDWDRIQCFLDAIAELEAQVKVNQGCAECGVKTTDGYALYCVRCSEPLREWVGLTDEDIFDLRKDGAFSVNNKDFRAIEAKLKELNT